MKKLKCILISALSMTVISILLLLLTALLLRNTGRLMRNAVPLITTAVACLSAIIGGFIASCGAGEKGLLMGCLAALLFLLILAIPAGVQMEAAFSLSRGAKLAAILLSGCVGGVLGVNRKEKLKF